MNRIKIGLVGFGSWGKRHYESWRRIPEADVVGIHDPAYRGRIFKKSLASLLKIVDAVDVVVPAESLTDVAITALESSKHVLVEKPMSTNVDEAKRLLAAANSHGSKIAMVGFIERFNPVFMRLHSIIGQLQGPGRIFCQRSGSPTLVARKAGVLKDLAIHDLDLLRWYLGEPDRVTIRSRGDFYLSQVEAKFQDVEVIVIADCLGPKIRRWVLTYVQDNIFAYFENDRWRLYMNYTEVPVEWHMPLEQELRHFVECIEEGVQPSPSIHDGLRILEVIENADVHD